MSQPENAKPADLRKEYDAPFAIISRNEGSRYISLTKRDFNPPRFLDFQDVASLGWTNSIDSYCRALSLQKFVKMRHHGYRELMLEFYTTLSFTDDGFQCRLMGKSVTVTLKKLCDIFGFSEKGHTTVPVDFDPTEFWRKIAGDGDFNNGMMLTKFIKDPALLLMCKYISHGVFGKAETARVLLKELFCLWCAYTGVPVCTPCFVLGVFKSVITHNRANMCLGNLITAIAVHFGRFDPFDTDMLVFPAQALKMKKDLKDYKSATEDDSSSDGDDDDGEDSNPVINDDQPAANTWMLISCKLEQMHMQMMDAMEARFDRLEKRVKAIDGLGKVESSGAKNVKEMKQKKFETSKSIEKLRLEKSKSDKAAEMYKARLQIVLPKLKKIQEILPKISSMNVIDLANFLNDMGELATFEVGENLGFPDSRGENDSLKNMIMPDVNAQEVAVLLPGVRATSTASGNTANGNRNRGLLNNGDGNSPQPRTSEDDIERSVKKSLVSDNANASGIISGGVRPCKATLSPSAAAGDTIIEIHDSDDETKPIIAVKTSKRVLSSDESENEMNFVQLSKRIKTEKVEKLSPFSNTGRKKDALTHGKGKEVLKSSHESVDFSGDSEDESLSDSRMEDWIASLRREKCVRKFMYEADMLSAFQQDEELCLNAVCALYRQTPSLRTPNGRLILSKKGGFSPIDSMSGCLLAEYLIDEDKGLRLTKSVSHVKRQRPDVITQCRRLATVYVGRLFEIYCTGDDPLFCQPC